MKTYIYGIFFIILAGVSVLFAVQSEQQDKPLASWFVTRLNADEKAYYEALVKDRTKYEQANTRKQAELEEHLRRVPNERRFLETKKMLEIIDVITTENLFDKGNGITSKPYYFIFRRAFYADTEHPQSDEDVLPVFFVILEYLVDLEKMVYEYHPEKPPFPQFNELFHNTVDLLSSYPSKEVFLTYCRIFEDKLDQSTGPMRDFVLSHMAEPPWQKIIDQADQEQWCSKKFMDYIFKLNEKTILRMEEFNKQLIEKGREPDEIKSRVIRRLEDRIKEQQVTATTAPTQPMKEQYSEDGRFIDHGDGTITDTRTGLMWTKTSSKKEMKYYPAQRYCAGLTTGGYTDWRLPTIDELETLYEPAKKHEPILEEVHYFIDPIFYSIDRIFALSRHSFISATKDKNDPYYFWYFSFLGGDRIKEPLYTAAFSVMGVRN